MQQTHTASSGAAPVAREPLLSVRDLATHFPLDEGNVVAVDGVSFDLYEGQTLGIVGESGCGKSVTALSIMMALSRPGRIVDGRILYRKRDGNDGPDEVIDLASLEPSGKEMRAIRGAEIGYIFQEPMTAFSPVHTVGNQLIEAIRLHRDIDKKGARSLAIELLRQVEVPLAEQRLDSYSWELSGGLRQRVMIAAVMASSPRVLIADEPTTALDVTTQAQILDLMRSLQQQSGTAIIMITHDLGVIAEMADHVAVMYLGKVVESAPVDDIFHAPSTHTPRPCSAPSRRSTPRQRESSPPSQAPCPTPTAGPRAASSIPGARSSWPAPATPSRPPCSRYHPTTT